MVLTIATYHALSHNLERTTKQCSANHRKLKVLAAVQRLHEEKFKDTGNRLMNLDLNLDVEGRNSREM